jgi:hypothetical protein
MVVSLGRCWYLKKASWSTCTKKCKKGCLKDLRSLMGKQPQEEGDAEHLRRNATAVGPTTKAFQSCSECPIQNRRLDQLQTGGVSKGAQTPAHKWSCLACRIGHFGPFPTAAYGVCIPVMHLVLFVMQNRTLGPHLAAAHGALIPATQAALRRTLRRRKWVPRRHSMGASQPTGS